MKIKQAKRRILALLLAVAILFSFAVPVVSAAGTAEISFGQVCGKRGEQVIVPVTIENNPGIASFRFRIAYDATALTYVSAAKGEAMTSGTLSAAYQSKDEELAITWFDVKNITGDGVLFNLVFEISDTAHARYPLEVSYLPEDIVNASWQQVDITVVDGWVEAGVDYIVKFVDEDGTELAKQTYQYGDEVIAPADPAKAADHIYSYTFSGWDKKVEKCTGNATYTATYEASYIDYTVVFKNWNGDVLSTNTYHYGDKVITPSVPTKPADNTGTYTFKGWDKAVVNCAGDTTYTATYTANYIEYTVVFKNWDGSVISTNTYHYGDQVIAPANPTKAGDKTYTYKFAGWDKTVVNCAGDATYIATYTPEYIDYIVTFKNWDGSVISTNTYHYGDKVIAPTDPTKVADYIYAYTFSGWDKPVVDCVGNEVYTATYTSSYIEYVVVFKNWNGDVLSSKIYHYGDSVTEPDVPTKPADALYSYIFKGWDKEIRSCVGNAEYIAVFVGDHQHTYKEQVTKPTCTEQGYTTYTCACGDTYKGAYVDATDHSYIPTVVKPTPVKQGYTEYTCHCGNSYRADYVAELDLSTPKVTITIDAAIGKPALNWANGGEGVTYEIHRATSKTGSYTKVATVAESSWIDTAASVGKTYYYKVKAIYAEDTSYNSGFSAVVSATAKCAAPVLTVKAGSTGKPVLTWNKITGAKKYEIWRSVDGGAFKKLTTSTKLTYTDSKATAGAECTYKVKALGSKSSYNGEFSSTGSCYVTCAAPSLTLKVDSKTGIPALSWKKITGAKSYAIYRSANGGEYQLLTTTTAVSYQDKSAAADNKYSYYVITLGKAEVFNSVPSAAKSVTLAVKAPKLSGSANANGKPVISWAAVENAVSYKIYRSTKSSKGYALVETITELSYTDTSVATGKTFYYKVIAVGTNTESAMSSYLKMVGKCATPTIQVVLDEDSGKPMISWEKIEGAKKYTVYRATSGTGKYKKLGTTTKLTYTDSKASVGTKYFYKIVANPSSSSANSNYSNIESCLTICAKAVVTVKVDTATGKPTISWKKVTGAKTYEIYRSENGGAYVLVATQTAVSYKDTTAVAGNAYSYQVKVIASKTGADSLPSAEKTVIATCAQPKVKGKVGATGKPELTWGEVEGATKYVIYRSTSKTKGFKALEETEDLSFTDSTAVKGKTYYYKVVAVCDDLESAQSAYVKVKSK